MRFLLIGLALLGSACAAQNAERGAPAAAATTVAAVDGAGNRLEALVANGERWCSANGIWCAEPTGSVTYVPDGSSRSIHEVSEREERAVWPFIVFVGGRDDHALIGFNDTRHDMYSGGGASFTGLTLYEVTGRDRTAIEPLLAVQSGGTALIRACFSEEDVRTRRKACHDEYAFAASLNLDPSVTSGHPRLLYASEAWTFPGRVSRTDGEERGPLAPGDLIWLRDETCSYRRTFTLTDENGYMPDAAQPECTDYNTQ